MVVSRDTTAMGKEKAGKNAHETRRKAFSRLHHHPVGHPCPQYGRHARGRPAVALLRGCLA